MYKRQDPTRPRLKAGVTSPEQTEDHDHASISIAWVRSRVKAGVTSPEQTEDHDHASIPIDPTRPRLKAGVTSVVVDAPVRNVIIRPPENSLAQRSVRWTSTIRAAATGSADLCCGLVRAGQWLGWWAPFGSTFWRSKRWMKPSVGHSPRGGTPLTPTRCAARDFWCDEGVGAARFDHQCPDRDSTRL